MTKPPIAQESPQGLTTLASAVKNSNLGTTASSLLKGLSLGLLMLLSAEGAEAQASHSIHFEVYKKPAATSGSVDSVVVVAKKGDLYRDMYGTGALTTGAELTAASGTTVISQGQAANNTTYPGQLTVRYVTDETGEQKAIYAFPAQAIMPGYIHQLGVSGPMYTVPGGSPDKFETRLFLKLDSDGAIIIMGVVGHTTIGGVDTYGTNKDLITNKVILEQIGQVDPSNDSTIGWKLGVEKQSADLIGGPVVPFATVTGPAGFEFFDENGLVVASISPTRTLNTSTNKWETPTIAVNQNIAGIDTIVTYHFTGGSISPYVVTTSLGPLTSLTSTPLSVEGPSLYKPLLGVPSLSYTSDTSANFEVSVANVPLDHSTLVQASIIDPNTGEEFPATIDVNAGLITSNAVLEVDADQSSRNFKVRIKNGDEEAVDTTSFQVINQTPPASYTLPSEWSAYLGENTSLETSSGVESSAPGSFNYSIVSGVLPHGLTLNSATGEISGVPDETTSGVPIILGVGRMLESGVLSSVTHSNTLTLKVLDTSSVGVEQVASVANDQFSVYPNPATNYLMIQINDQITHPDFKGSWEIYDVQAKKKLQGECEHNTKVDISDLPGGIYLLRVYDYKKGSMSTVKFIKN